MAKLSPTLALGLLLLTSAAPGPAAAATQEAKLTDGDAAASDFFGISVAVSGDTMVVGANGDDDAGSNSGSAFVFVRSGTTWIEQAQLTAGDAVAGDVFGHSVAVSGDTVVVGAERSDDAGTSSGSAYVFVRSGTSSSQQAKLTAGDAQGGDFFGRSVAVSGDTALVGADRDDDAGTSSGSAYVFVRSGTIWSQQAKLTAGDAALGDFFGFSVGVSGDTAVVGAYQNDDAFSNSGSAYVFVRSGTIWSQQAQLTAGDAAEDDQFGISVGVSGDTAVVGAHRNDDGGLNSGSAYVFRFAVPEPTVPVSYAGDCSDLDAFHDLVKALDKSEFTPKSRRNRLARVIRAASRNCGRNDYRDVWALLNRAHLVSDGAATPKPDWLPDGEAKDDINAVALVLRDGYAGEFAPLTVPATTVATEPRRGLVEGTAPRDVFRERKKLRQKERE